MHIVRTTSLRGWDRESPCSANKWLTGWGGEEEPASQAASVIDAVMMMMAACAMLRLVSGWFSSG